LIHSTIQLNYVMFKEERLSYWFWNEQKNGTFLVVGGNDPFKDLFKNAFELPLY